MSLTVRLKCEEPGEIVYTMTITMTAKEFEQVRDNLESADIKTYPTHQLIRHINDLLSQARKIYWPTSNPSDE